MSQSVLPGPIAPENNPPVNIFNYQPRVFDIEAITLGVTTTVTTTVDHNYVVGQYVRLLIPSTYGSVQLNERPGYVINIPAANEVVIDINSLSANAFIPSPTYGPTPPQIVPIGDVNSGQINTSGRVSNKTYIPGSFINISPFPT